MAGLALATINVRRFSGWKPTTYRWGVITGQPPQIWERRHQNYLHHKPFMEKGINQLKDKHKGQRMIVVGSGRSIVKHNHADVLRELKRSGDVVITINGAIMLLDPSLIDYHFVYDFSAKKEWTEGRSTRFVTAICAASSPKHISDHFDDRYYFGDFRTLKPELADEHYEKIGELEGSCVSTYSVLHLAWQMGIREVVLIGHDFAWTDNWYQAYERWPMDMCEKLKGFIHQDLNGYPTITDEKLSKNAHLVHASSIFCEEDGMRIINCSEEGILGLSRQARLVDYLKEEVKDGVGTG